jgi:quinol monooxygenase YgiN
MNLDIRFVAFLKVKPGSEQAMEAAARTCVPASRGEDGCLLYAAHWDQGDRNRLVFIEHWASQAALDEHMRTPHFHAFVAAIRDLVEGAPDIITLREIR